MHILLAAATTFEIQPALDFLLERRIHSPTASDPLPRIHSPTASDPPPRTHRFSTLITGIGSLPTTWSLMRQIDRDRPDLIIQAGIAGCFSGRPPGEVLVIRDETLADLGV